MIRTVISIIALVSLTGCVCLPEEGEGVDSGYFDSCWSKAKSGPRNQGLFPKP